MANVQLIHYSAITCFRGDSNSSGRKSRRVGPCRGASEAFMKRSITVKIRVQRLLDGVAFACSFIIHVMYSRLSRSMPSPSCASSRSPSLSSLPEAIPICGRVPVLSPILGETCSPLLKKTPSCELSFCVERGILGRWRSVKQR